MCCVLQSVGDPLSLSLGLDILEEILAAGDRAKYAKLMAREGALAAVVRAHICPPRLWPTVAPRGKTCWAVP